MTLDDRLRTASRALSEEVSPVPETAALSRRSRRLRVHRLVGAAITGLIVLGVLGITVHNRDAGTVTADAGAMLTVRYEKVQYSQEANLSCPKGQLPQQRLFNRSTFEAWADNEGQRWRSTVTYPDGQRRDVVALDSPWYPSQLSTRGEIRGAGLGCTGDIGVMVAEPGQNSFFSLNPLADPPLIDDTGQPAVISYTAQATLIPGLHTDSLGRSAQLWRSDISGFMTGDANPGVSTPVDQTTETFVDPASGDILERTYENNIHGVGAARWKETRVGWELTHVPASFFDTDGYKLVAEGKPSVAVHFRCPNTSQAFERPGTANEAGDGLPPSGSATRQAAQAAEADSRHRFGATNSRIVEIKGRAWNEGANGVVQIVSEQLFVILLTLPTKHDCPRAPAMVSGVPILFQYVHDG